MDEITLFRELRPAPPDNAAQIREAARARLSEAMSRPAGHPGRERARAGAGFWPAQHRSLWLAVVVTLAACAAIIVSLVLPSGRPPSGRPTVHPGGKAVTVTTAAWTVHRAPNGTITVNVKQLRDPAGLQRTLREEGVPAYVRYIPIVQASRGAPSRHIRRAATTRQPLTCRPARSTRSSRSARPPPRSRARSRSSSIRRLSRPVPPSSSRWTRDRRAAAAPPPATPSP